MDTKVWVEMVLLQLREYCSGLKDNIYELDDVFRRYMENDEEYRNGQKERLAVEGLNIVHIYSQRKNYYYIMTFLLHATKSKEIYKELLRYSISDNSITKESKYFLYNQFICCNFLESDLADGEIKDLLDDLYSHIYQAYKEEIAEEYEFIQKEDRNQDFVMVFVSQVLDMRHGPTKTLLDRCYMLEKFLNKKVYIVNTAELLSKYQMINCFDAMGANYIEAYSDINHLSYKGKEFAFFQCPADMPQVSVIKEILDVVKSEKPYFILTIGGNSMVSDICSNIIPTITIGTVPSNRAVTRGQFQTIGRKITEEDRKWMQKHHLAEDHIIESLFTSAFKEQKHHYTRRELGLPEDKFICILVGGRLDEEIDSDCMDMLQRLADAGIYIAFIGVFNRYQKYADQNETFRNNSINLGFQDDVLAVDECCDLYINPKRIGGGTSAAEALYKGLPVVTFDFGDVGVGAGADFHVSGYEDMYNHIMKYVKDKEYYAEMSTKARERAACLTDSKTEFIKIIQKAEESDRF